jgi:dihydropteroate synthase
MWRLTDRTLDLAHPLAAGIVNVTTDSMFSGARSGTAAQAIEDGVELAEAGFGMLDVGAVAARSGPPVSAEDEAARLVPAVEELVALAGIPVSADTFSAEVAERALDAGAHAINDISGARDPVLFELVAQHGCGMVLMHIDGPPREDREIPRHEDPIDHLKAWFTERMEAAVAAGVDELQLVLDPGLDFDLGVHDDLEILRRIGELHSLGRPIYLSLSRKDFLGAVLAGSWEERSEPGRREWATAAAVALAVDAGVQIHRLHDASALQALQIAAAIDDPMRAEAMKPGAFGG